MFRFQLRSLTRILQPSVLYTTNPPIRKNQPLLEKLTAEFGNASLVNSALENSELNDTYFNDWRDRIYELKRYGFSHSYCFQMFTECPGLLKVPVKEFEEALLLFFNTDINIADFQEMLLTTPHLLEVDVEQIRKRVPPLRALFRTGKAFSEVLTNSPNIMFDDWDSVQTKLHYLMKERRFKIGEIMHSTALSESIHFIKLRIDLLEKCGIYKQDYTPVHKQNEYDISKHKNPPLRSILVKEPKDFIKIAKISLEEYYVFSNLYMEEEESEEEDLEDLSKSYEKKNV